MTITSDGKRNPVNADFGGNQGRRRLDSLTGQACLGPRTQATQQPRLGLHPDVPVVLVDDDPVGDVQPEAGSSPTGLVVKNGSKIRGGLSQAEYVPGYSSWRVAYLVHCQQRRRISAWQRGLRRLTGVQCAGDWIRWFSLLVSSVRTYA